MKEVYISTDTYSPDWKNCSYCKTTYYEYDTGYEEVGCAFGNSDPHKIDCDERYCPLRKTVTINYEI